MRNMPAQPEDGALGTDNKAWTLPSSGFRCVDLSSRAGGGCSGEWRGPDTGGLVFQLRKVPVSEPEALFDWRRGIKS